MSEVRWFGVRKFGLAAVAGALVLAVSGCVTANSSAHPAQADPAQAPLAANAHIAANPLIEANYAAASRLLSHLRGRLGEGEPLLAATVVNIDALERSSTLGRLITEQVSARFTLAGYRMIEMKFRNDVYMARDQGELMLTREIRAIASTHSAQAVIVGTYALSSEMVFVNLKVIQPDTNVALSPAARRPRPRSTEA